MPCRVSDTGTVFAVAIGVVVVPCACTTPDGVVVDGMDDRGVVIIGSMVVVVAAPRRRPKMPRRGSAT